jgi:sugar (pentulose or hexulose) kinase
LAHSINSPKPGWAEQDGEKIWWTEAVEVIKNLLSHPRAEKVEGIGVSGLCPALLLADGSGKPLYPALLYSDERATQELERLNRDFSLQLTVDAIIPKLAWLRVNRPDVFRKAKLIFSSHNYIVYRLTGSYCLDYKVADSLGGLLERTRLEWRKDIANWAGIDTADLPRLCSAIEVVGQVTREAAKATGLEPGVPVIASSSDSVLTILGAGVISTGEALLSLGTTGWLGILTNDLEDYFGNPLLINQGAPYLLEAYLHTLGSSLQWYRDRFAIRELEMAKRLGKSAYQLLDNMAASVPAGSDGLIIRPYLQGKRQDTAICPEVGVIYGLNLSHKLSHLFRALLESYGYIVRSALKRLSEQGIEVDRIFCAGGGSSSILWRQIISDIIGKSLHYRVDTGPCLGNAYLVGYALGTWDSLAGIIDWLPDAVVCNPSDEMHSIYNYSFKRFLDLEHALSRGVE